MKNIGLCLLAVVLLAPARVEADVWDVGTGNDNTFGGTENQLVHETRQVHDLGALAGPVADQDWYVISVPPYSSFEIVIDGTTTDINPLVQRFASDGTTLAQTASSIGIGFSKRLAWANTTGFSETSYMRVGNASCGSVCDSADQYTISSHETTISLARFNNAGSQITVPLTQNASDVVINASFFYWSTTGTLLQEGLLAGFPARNLNVFNTTSFAALMGVGGHITIAHNGPYGGLNVKGVALEPATGFSFDTPGVYRGR